MPFPRVWTCPEIELPTSGTGPLFRLWRCRRLNLKLSDGQSLDVNFFQPCCFQQAQLSYRHRPNGECPDGNRADSKRADGKCADSARAQSERPECRSAKLSSRHKNHLAERIPAVAADGFVFARPFLGNFSLPRTRVPHTPGFPVKEIRGYGAPEFVAGRVPEI